MSSVYSTTSRSTGSSARDTENGNNINLRRVNIQRSSETEPTTSLPTVLPTSFNSITSNIINAISIFYRFTLGNQKDTSGNEEDTLHIPYDPYEEADLPYLMLLVEANNRISCEKTEDSFKLQLYIYIKSVTTIVLIFTACLVSSLNFPHIAYVHYASTTTNSMITVAVSIYSFITSFIHISAFTDFVRLMTLVALNGDGKYILTSNQWSNIYSHTGKYYYSIPSMIIGLTSPILITILTVVKLNSKYQTHILLAPLVNEALQCTMTNLTINEVCSDIDAGFSTIISYRNYRNTYNTEQSNMVIQIDKQSFTKDSMGYPISIFSNVSNTYIANNIPIESTYIETPYEVCVWILNSNPIQCSWTYSKIENEIESTSSPYTSTTFIRNISNKYQNLPVLQITPELVEFAIFQPSIVSSIDGYINADAFICSISDISQNYTGKWIQSTRAKNSINTLDLISASNNTKLCMPTYRLANYQSVIKLVTKLANTIQLFSSVTNTNELIDSFAVAPINSTSDNISYIYQFSTSKSLLEDGISTLFSIILSKSYDVKLGNSSTYTTIVTGGPYVYTVGYSSKYFTIPCIFMILFPLTYIIITARTPEIRVPRWDVLNPTRALSIYTQSYRNRRSKESRPVVLRMSTSTRTIVAIAR
jgi:hypothetical protein